MLIDKEFILNKFKEYTAKNDKDEEDEDSYNSEHAKHREHSRLQTLEQVRWLYEFIVKNAMLMIRREYIHDDEKFKKVKHSLESYVQNKIKSTSDGHIYIKVNDLLSFTGDRDQYAEWMIDNKNKRVRVIKNIVDELNSFLEGNPIEDDRKSMLSNVSENAAANYILNRVPEICIAEAFNEGNTLAFIESVKKVLIEIGVVDEEDFFEKLNEHFTTDKEESIDEDKE
jgi:hypothetical protein